MKPAALFLFIALLLAGSPISAQTFTKVCSTGQELEYRVLSDPKTVEVKKVTNMGSSSNVIIPEEVSYEGREFEDKGDTILRDPEVRAMFPGGVDSLKKFLNENVKLSPRCIEVQCVVILEFVVEIDGSITSINVLSNYCGACQEYVNDAVRLVKAMPKWDPAQDDGQPCRSYFLLPVSYCLR